MSARDRCPACGAHHTEQVYRVDRIPVQSCVLLDSEDEARAFPVADLALAFCRDCGFAFNAIFEPALVDYGAATEESQAFSNTFNRFAEGLVEEIAARYGLEGVPTVEIGCGKGDFLVALARRTGTVGIGIDPGYVAGRQDVDGLSVDFRREIFRPDALEEPPAFVVCRHTLEHIADAEGFLADIAKATQEAVNVGLFFETPSACRIFAEGAFWDVYYEHCSYFTPGAHARLFRRAGFDVTGLSLAYDDQYIVQHARTGGTGDPLPIEESPEDARRLVLGFAETAARQRAHWDRFIRERHAAGKRIAIWGGGSKAVSFLTTLGIGEEVADVIDINPTKQGRYLPASGHRIVAPEALVERPPDTVLVMNRIYLPEVRARLDELGLIAELVAP